MLIEVQSSIFNLSRHVSDIKGRYSHMCEWWCRWICTCLSYYFSNQRSKWNGRENIADMSFVDKHWVFYVHLQITYYNYFHIIVYKLVYTSIIFYFTLTSSIMLSLFCTLVRYQHNFCSFRHESCANQMQGWTSWWTVPVALCGNLLLYLNLVYNQNLELGLGQVSY